MAENVIAIILPEYDDKDNVITSDDWKSKTLFNDAEIGKHIKELAEFVDFFSDENCRMTYDSKNVAAFTYVLRTMPECYPSREFLLRMVLKKVTNWRMNRESDAKDEYSMDYVKLQDETRCELAARKAKDNSHSCLIAAHIPAFKARIWTLIKDEKKYDIHSCLLNIQEVFNWISQHHKPIRIYNWNPKHGENGYGAHKRPGEHVSILLCSKEHAAELLSQAIGLKNGDSLYNYDADYGKYMEYKAECKYENLHSSATDRKYHSYHLNSDESIPKRVIEKMKTLEYIP